jgi:hypothetical protein
MTVTKLTKTDKANAYHGFKDEHGSTAKAGDMKRQRRVQAKTKDKNCSKLGSTPPPPTLG